MHARWRLKRLLWRDREGWQEREESATEYFRLVAFAAVCIDEYINNGSKLELLALTPSNYLDVSVHATSVSV